MDPTGPQSSEDRIEHATVNRLSRLNTIPVELAGITRAIEAQIPRPKRQTAIRFDWMTQPLRIVAASMLLLTAVGALIIVSASGPTLASAERLAQIHRETSSGMSGPMPVDSIEAANKALTEINPGVAKVPGLPGHPPMACCIQQLGRKALACVSIRIDNAPVTIAAADATDIQVPPAMNVVRDGVSYAVQSSGSTNMVMTVSNGKWVCLMGDVPAERLLDVAAQLRH